MDNKFCDLINDDTVRRSQILIPSLVFKQSIVLS